MGAYINTPNESKENWVKDNGTEITKEEAKKHKDFKKGLVVAVLDNFLFTAACIAFDQRELDVITSEKDERPIGYFIVERNKLMKVSNLKDYTR